MRERPILFSVPMVRAILAGTKTQTRRLLSYQPTSAPEVYRAHKDRALTRPVIAATWIKDGESHCCPCPFGVPGDRLWVITLKPIAFGGGKYAAGDDGHIYDVSGSWPRRRRAAITEKGYEEIALRANGDRRNFRVNRLVAEAFYGPPKDSLPVCRHLDGCRRNNSPENLDWGTEAQNSADATAAGAWSGSANGGARLSADDVASIRSSNEPQAVLANRYCTTQPTISKIKSGKRWRSEHPPAPAPNSPRWASRITLEVTGVRVEQLQEISHEDAKAEGAEFWRNDGTLTELPPCSEHRYEFEDLWTSIHGADSWNANPWVWAVSFQRLDAKEAKG